jgi:hypothetical protein
MKTATILLISYFLVIAPAQADSYGAVEPIANPAVIDTGPLSDQDLDVREAFAERLLQCGIVDFVIDVLTQTGSISTINGLNTSFDVAAGGFAGNTNPTYAYTMIDSGPNSVSIDDIKVLTDSLGYVLSQGSAFLLDADDTSSFDFPANYVVLNFDGLPSIEESAALFETVGEIDPEIFETDTSGYTQYGFAYLSLQSFVPDEQFIDGYVQAADEFGVEYTPIVAGEPSLFTGGAGFPGNNWNDNPDGDALDNLAEYAMGGNPDDAGNIGNATTTAMTEETGTNYLQYVYFERDDAVTRGLSSSLEVGPSLLFTNGWGAAGIEFVGSGASGIEGYNAVTNRISTDDDDSRFLNLQIQFTPAP